MSFGVCIARSYRGKGEVMWFAVDVRGMGRNEAYVFWCKLMEL